MMMIWVFFLDEKMKGKEQTALQGMIQSLTYHFMSLRHVLYHNDFQCPPTCTSHHDGNRVLDG